MFIIFSPAADTLENNYAKKKAELWSYENCKADACVIKCELSPSPDGVCVGCSLLRSRRTCCPVRCSFTVSEMNWGSCGLRVSSTSMSSACWTRLRTSNKSLRSWRHPWPASTTCTPQICWWVCVFEFYSFYGKYMLPVFFFFPACPLIHKNLKINIAI